LGERAEGTQVLAVEEDARIRAGQALADAPVEDDGQGDVVALLGHERPAAAERAAAARTVPSLRAAFSVGDDRHDAALGEQGGRAPAAGLDPPLVQREDRAVGAEAARLRDLRE